MTEVLLAVAAAALSPPASAASAAQPRTYQDARGRAWHVAGSTVDSRVLARRGVRIELHSTCIATSKRLGTGRWAWANGGFVVTFARTRIAFPRQSIDAGQGGSCRA